MISIKNKLPSFLLFLLLMLLWQIIGMGIDAEYILPTPIQVCQRLYELRIVLFTVHLPATMQTTFIGLAISIILGVGLAILMDTNHHMERALYPVVIASQTIPTTAIAPLFVLWFGYSIWSKVLVTILMTFFPITISVHDGLKSGKREMEELLVTYGARKPEIYLKLKFPNALPQFFSSIKMAIPLSIIGAAVGEWLGAQEGLGYFSKRMLTQLDGSGVFAPILLLSVTAMLITSMISFFEKRLIHWRNEL